MANKAPFYIPSLDGIRVVAFSIVFLAHAGLGEWIPAGFGVTIFFFLSGYLITTLIRREHEKFGNLDFKLFYIRRVLRIWPSFYLTLIVATGLTLLGLLSGSLEWPAVLIQFFHVANYGVMHSWTAMAPGTDIYWSLAVEEHFYLIFPWFYLFLIRCNLTSKQQAGVLWALCSIVLVWRCILVFGLNAPETRVFYGTDTRIDSILFGCILAVHGNPMMDDSSITSAHSADYSSSHARSKQVLLPLGFGLLAISFAVRNAEFRETLRYTIQGLALIPIFIIAIREPKFILFRWLNIRWIRFLGLMSYSLYLVHHVVIIGVSVWGRQWHPVSQGALSLALSIAIAYALYITIEQPMVDIRKQFARKS